MRTLSAAEAMTPAIERTKAILFKPFRAGRTWKLTATAYLGRMGTVFIPFPLVYLFVLPAARVYGQLAVAGLVLGTVALTLLLLSLFYLGSRLQFAFFDILVFRGQFVAPAWRKYALHTRPWTMFKVLAGMVLTLICTLPIAGYVHHIRPLFEAMISLKPGQPPPAEFLSAFFAGYGIVLLIFGPFFLVSSLLSDFIVPMLALEELSVKEALQRLIALVRREPGQFALYTLLKVVLGFAIYMGAVIAWEIVIVLCTLVLAALGGLLTYFLHLAGVPSAVLSSVAVILGIFWYGFLVVYTLLLTAGVVMTFLDAYALYFLAGRYPALDNALDLTEPPLGYTYAYPPPPPAVE